ncbi:unnamed protein product [Onchocerca ochengi]|uniref:Cyclin-dependent kinase 11B n=1 Tax=Onchocerca ochengi TaxID=42157 RepID=A0A182EE05_ONCOC|nr:unnamed protein product [Onchocerca ochengi]
MTKNTSSSFSNQYFRLESEKRVRKSDVAKESNIKHKKLKLEKYNEEEKKVQSGEKTKQHSRRRSNSPDQRKHAQSYHHERSVSRKIHVHKRPRSRETYAHQRSRSRETRTHQRSYRR